MNVLFTSQMVGNLEIKNRFRFLKQVIQSIQERVPDDFCITIKLNTNDFTPKPGVTPELAVEYAGMLKDIGVDMIEVSCGSSIFSYMNMCRGDVPVKEMVQSMPFWKKPRHLNYVRQTKTFCWRSRRYSIYMKF